MSFPDDLSPLIAGWPVSNASAAVTDSTATLGSAGDAAWVTRIASVSKLLVGYAALVAIEEETISLDGPAGPEGATVRHLLAHASGLAFDDHRELTPPATRRIYSNTGIERFAMHLADRAEMPFSSYLHQAVFEPLGMVETSLRGSPAHEVHSTVDDLLRFARELLNPTLITAGTLTDATRPHFPELKGALPGVGSFDPLPWGLTFEIKGGKAAGQRFIDSLELFYHVANIGDARSLAIHPATTTHSQLSPADQEATGVTESYVRLSVGIEHIDDILADLDWALGASQGVPRAA